MDKYYAFRDGNTVIHVRYDTSKETLHMYGVNDATDLILQNTEERKDPSNGFSASREGAFGRKIASIDPVVYRLWQKEFEKIGGKLQPDWVKDWRVFLRKKLAENPQYYTVEKLVSHNVNEGHVVVK